MDSWTYGVALSGHQFPLVTASGTMAANYDTEQLSGCISKDGGQWTALTNDISGIADTAGANRGEAGWYCISEITATEMQCYTWAIKVCADSGCLVQGIVGTNQSGPATALDVSGHHNILVAVSTCPQGTWDEPWADREVATSGMNKILTAVSGCPGGTWDEALTDHTDAGSFGEEVPTHATPTEVNSQVDTALADIDLDHLTNNGTAVPAVAAGTFLDQIMDDGTETYSRTTDSLQAIRDRGDAAWTTGAGTGLTALATGTAQAGAAGTITLAAGASSTNDLYNGARIMIHTGTGAGQSRIITDYNGTTKVASIAPNWVTNPSSDSEYEIQAADSSLGTIQNDGQSVTDLKDFVDVGYDPTDNVVLISGLHKTLTAVSGATAGVWDEPWADREVATSGMHKILTAVSGATAGVWIEPWADRQVGASGLHKMLTATSGLAIDVSGNHNILVAVSGGTAGVWIEPWADRQVGASGLNKILVAVSGLAIDVSGNHNILQAVSGGTAGVWDEPFADRIVGTSGLHQVLVATSGLAIDVSGNHAILVAVSGLTNDVSGLPGIMTQVSNIIDVAGADTSGTLPYDLFLIKNVVLPTSSCIDKRYSPYRWYYDINLDGDTSSYWEISDDANTAMKGRIV